LVKSSIVSESAILTFVNSIMGGCSYYYDFQEGLCAWLHMTVKADNMGYINLRVKLVTSELSDKLPSYQRLISSNTSNHCEGY